MRALFPTFLVSLKAITTYQATVKEMVKIVTDDR